jgi:glycosyltransferase involved in cell wall biosynthesis
MKQKSKVVACHLLNDFSGSPLIFSQVLKGLQEAGHEVTLHTSSGRDGFLDRIECRKKLFHYRFYSNSLLRLFAFTMSQLQLFLQVWAYRKEDVVIYINTLLPWGGALAGKLTGKKVVYHIHESYLKPAPLRLWLRFVASISACYVFYVSQYLKNEEELHGVSGEVLYNALPDEFLSLSESHQYNTTQQNDFRVLMICSLKNYKGIPEFITLASRHPHLHFELVLNASMAEISTFFQKNKLPSNLTLYPAQQNLDPFYRKASLVVNLTNPALCKETFGMTLLEGMSYGIPVIAPPVGGPAELVNDGENGLLVDAREVAKLDEALEKLCSSASLRSRFSEASRAKAHQFSSEILKKKVKERFAVL